MKDLLKKIVEMDTCSRVAEVYLYVNAQLSKLDADLDAAAKIENFDVFNHTFSEVNTLINMLEDELINFSTKEYGEVERGLYDDYYSQIDQFKRNEILDPTGKFYECDYGRHAGQKFVLPNIRDIFGYNNRKIFWLYKKMEAAGMQPKLQMTPIGYKIDTLIKKIWPRGGATSLGGFFSEGILRYEPDSIDLSADGKRLDIKGGVSKNRWIEKHKGWLVELVSAKSPYVLGEKDRMSVQEHVTKSVQDMQKIFLKPMTVEGFLINQLRQRAIEEKTEPSSNILIGSFMPKQPVLLRVLVGADYKVRLELDEYNGNWDTTVCPGAANIVPR